jgi:hypothetical protein
VQDGNVQAAALVIDDIDQADGCTAFTFHNGSY